jgi:aminomethyltransferase
MSESEPPIHSFTNNGTQGLHLTPLNALHRELGAKLVPFAGYEMPLHYAQGIVKEHLHLRAAAGLFDVSHMGQLWVEGPDIPSAAAAIERFVPGDILNLRDGRLRYTQLTNKDGGIIDDLMVARAGHGFSLVVNASRKALIRDYLAPHFLSEVKLRAEPGLALLALQGPKAAAVLARIFTGAERLSFMARGVFCAGEICAQVSRAGYTGEDGFEISLAAEEAEALARRLLAQPEVLPIGLGARDTLRLEAGLCLYGQDVDEATTPVEANLSWSIGKRRRLQGGFPGAEHILHQLSGKPERLRVGLRLQGRAAARTHTPILDPAGNPIGEVTSGAFTPTAAASIAMGYVPPSFSTPGTKLAVNVRGNAIPSEAVALPFVPHRYARPA